MAVVSKEGNYAPKRLAKKERKAIESESILKKRSGLNRAAVEFKSLTFKETDAHMTDENVFADNAGDVSDNSNVDSEGEMEFEKQES